jgi:hypothetical protein
MTDMTTTAALNARLEAVITAAVRQGYKVEDSRYDTGGRYVDLSYHGLVNGSEFVHIATFRGRITSVHRSRKTTLRKIEDRFEVRP